MSHVRYVPVLLIVVVLLVLPFSPTAAAPQPSTLVVYSPTLYGPILQRTAVKAMKEKYNTEIIYQDSNGAEMIAKLKASAGRPEATVACPDTGSFLVGEAAGFWDNLDVSKLTNLKDIQSFAKSPPFYGKTGIAITNGAIGIQYHTEVFTQRGWAAPKSWKDLTRPEFKGRVGLTTTVSGVGLAQLSFWSRMEGAPRGDITPGIRFAKSLVESGQVQFFPNRSSEVNELMQRGEIWISTQWMEGAQQGAANGLPFGWVFPSEGTYLFPTGCSVVRDGPGSKEQANLFINELISEETQRELTLDRWAIPVRIGIKLPPQYQAILPLTEVRTRAIKARPADFAEFAEFRDRWHALWVREVEKR